MPLTEQQFATEIGNVAGANHAAWNQTRAYGNRVYMGRGACRAIAAVWLAYRKVIGGGGGMSADERLDQAIWLMEPAQRQDSMKAVEQYLRSHALRPDGMIYFSQGVNWQKLWIFLNAKPGYYLVGVDPVGHGEGHEIGFCTVGGVRMFDPNYGFCSFADAASMRQFHTLYWPRAYPDLAAGTASIFRYI